MRRLMVLLAVVAVGGTALSSAQAAGPIRVPESFPDPVIRPAGKVCVFPVELQALDFQVYDLVFPTDPNGDTRIIATGHVVEMITNLATGASVTVNVSGPVFITVHPDGSVSFILAGRSSIDLFPTDIPPGPEVILNSGRLFLELTTSSQFVVSDQMGHLENVCTLLS